MRIRKLLILFLLFYTPYCFGQNEWSNWYFGPRIALSFLNGGLPQVKTNFINPIPSYWYSYYYNYNNATAYSDPATGQMRFLLSGRFAYDKNYDMIPASLNLRVCPGDKYSFHIIPFSGNPDKFYIIQFQDLFADLLAAETGLQVRCPNAIGLGYSVLDLSQRNGLGDFSSINNVLTTGIPLGITLVRHANGKDTWVLVHGWNNNNFLAYLFTDSGVTGPVVSSIGPLITRSNPSTGGPIAASHDGKTIAASMTGRGVLDLFDFDNSTGKLSGYRTITLGSHIGSLVFSPDNTKLYYLGSYLGPGVYQLDLDVADVQGSLTKIADDPHTSMYDMQLGLDGRIYIGGRQEMPDYFSTQYILPVINCPNLAKYACNYDQDGFLLPLNYSYSQFQNFINDYIRQPKAQRATEFSLGADTAICFGSFKLSAPVGWQHYKWNTGETTREITTTKPGVYYVLAGDLGFSCPTAFGSINLANAAKQLDLGKDTVLCPGLSYTVQLPPNFHDPLWNDGTTVPEKTMAGVGGILSVTAKDENGCVNRDTISIGFKYDPRAQFGKDTTLCEGQTLLLQLLPANNWWQKADSYLWQNGSVKDSFRVTTPGTYWGKVTYQGCTVSDTIQVGYASPQSINLGADTTLCAGDSLLLQLAVPNVQLDWSTGATGNAITVRNGGSYWVRVNNGTCTVTDTIKVNMQPKFALSLGKDTVICNRENLVLTPGIANASFLWQDGSKTASYKVTGAGTYWVKATVNGCSVTDSVLVNYKPLPQANLGPDTRICAGKSILLDATNPGIQSYNWSNGSAQPAITVSNTGSYWVKVQGVNDCFNSDTVTVTTIPLPVFSLGSDTVLCEGSTLQIQFASTGATYLWNTGNTTNSITIGQPGTYWLALTQNGCSSSDTLQLAYKPMPRVFLGNDSTLCEGSQKLLDATNINASYHWQDGNASSTYLVSMPGTYSVTVNLDGCLRSDTVTFNYRYKPRFSLGRDTSLCEGMELKLNPGIANASLLWQDGTTTPVYVVKNPGLYRLVASNDCGSSSDEIAVERGVCQLLMPNAFTPNGDGTNDVFRVKYPGFIQSFSMTVFDRWGGIIFETSDPTKGWDGKCRGIDQNSGAYIWQISLTTKQGEKMQGKGTVMLIR